MKHLTRVALVFLLVSSLVIGQNNVLFAQNNTQNSTSTPNDVINPPALSDREASNPANYAGLDNLIAFAAARNSTAKVTSAPLFATRLNVLPPAGSNLPSSAPSAPQGSSSTKNLGLLAGLAMAGTGAVLVLRKEPVHQTTCIPYDACPVPGIVQMTGGILLGVGVPLTIFKLKNR